MFKKNKLYVPQESSFSIPLKYTIPPEINSNDFGRFLNKSADSNSIFVAAKIFFLMIRIFGVFKVQSHTM